jgi:ABC-type multidrug transport system fused ATPase/permease subunit
LGTTTHSKKSDHKSDVVATEEGDRVIKAILPRYEIDSVSDAGLKPKEIYGRITFKDVVFSYPTRPNETVLNGLNTEICAGQTVAFVGPR